ncbi:MAG: DUF1971 domain-containing protein [Acetobacteraceae bacterium]|nr:DUF1971 domain-containing protein [Acetobacteraceae bacterium]
MLEGKLRYCIERPPSEIIVEPGDPGVIAPEVRHHVETLGPVRFYVEFYHDAPSHSPLGNELVDPPSPAEDQPLRPN